MMPTAVLWLRAVGIETEGMLLSRYLQGNHARFINHSCEPNCETQKWMVRGELAIGLFALSDIANGEELTFDYNFERYGDKPMRCYCGSKRCRKFIGGTQVGGRVQLGAKLGVR
jgi:histone-lysine N-methyltransferase SETD2